MANPARQLTYDVIARIDKLEKGMAKAGYVVDQQSSKMESRLKSLSARSDSIFANFGKGLFAGIAAGGAVGLVKGFGDVAKSVSDIGRSAKQAGVDARAFQELQYVAEKNRIPVDALKDGLKELSAKASEFATTGKGGAASAFRELGISSASLTEKLKDPAALFTEIIGKLGQLNKSTQIRLSDKIFGGTAGEKFVALIDQGKEGITATIDEAHRLGLVMTDDVIKKAEILDQKFNTVSTTVGTALKTAIVEAASAMGQFISLFQSFENRGTDALQGQRNLLLKEQQAAQRKLGKFGGLFDGPAFDTIEKTGSQIAKIDDELKKRAYDQLRTDLTVQKNQLENPIKPIPEPAKKAKAIPKTADDRINSELQQIKDRTAALISEAEMVGKSYEAQEKRRMSLDLEQAALVALREEARKKGVTDLDSIKLSDEHKQKIDAVSEAYAKQAENLRKVQEQQDKAEQAAGDFYATFKDGAIGAITGANSLSDALANLAKKLGDLLLNSAFDALFKPASGNSPGGSMGNIFSGIGKILGFSSGGYTGDRGVGDVAGVVHGREFVVNAQATARNRPLLEAMNRGVPGYKDGGYVSTAMPAIAPIRAPTMPNIRAASNNNQPIVVHFSPSIDNRGASIEAVAENKRQLDQLKAELPAHIIMTVRKAQQSRSL